MEELEDNSGSNFKDQRISQEESGKYSLSVQAEFGNERKFYRMLDVAAARIGQRKAGEFSRNYENSQNSRVHLKDIITPRLVAGSILIGTIMGYIIDHYFS